MRLALLLQLSLPMQLSWLPPPLLDFTPPFSFVLATICIVFVLPFSFVIVNIFDPQPYSFQGILFNVFYASIFPS
jgi:hypothetical protein